MQQNRKRTGWSKRRRH